MQKAQVSNTLWQSGKCLWQQCNAQSLAAKPMGTCISSPISWLDSLAILRSSSYVLEQLRRCLLSQQLNHPFLYRPRQWLVRQKNSSRTENPDNTIIGQISQLDVAHVSGKLWTLTFKHLSDNRSLNCWSRVPWSKAGTGVSDMWLELRTAHDANMCIVSTSHPVISWQHCKLQESVAPHYQNTSLCWLTQFQTDAAQSIWIEWLQVYAIVLTDHQNTQYTWNQ